MKKFEFVTEDTIEVGIILTRIRALIDIPQHGVKVGDLGGYLEKEENLYHDGDCWVFGDAWVSGDAQVFGDACVCGDAQVFGTARVYGNAQVYDDACVFGNAQVSDNARVYGNARVSEKARVSGVARVFGAAWVYGDACVSGVAQIETRNQIVWFSNVGTENGTLTAYVTKSGEIELTRGCFRGSIVEFTMASKKKHVQDMFDRYQLLIQFIKLQLNEFTKSSN